MLEITLQEQLRQKILQNGKSTIDKDSIRVVNSKGEDVTNDKNIVLEKEITDGKVKILLDKIDKDEEYKIVYDVIYAK